MTKEELLKKKICVVSLGCDKNTVDSERILFRLNEFGFDVVGDPKQANVIIVNTCAFIEPARIESVEKITEMVKLKSKKVENVIVVGCLPAKTDFDFKKELPKVDLTLGTRSEDKIIESICKLYNVSPNSQRIKMLPCQRIVSTPKHYAYLKIADGCDNKCSYCTIPQIRGRFVSEKIETLVDEAKELVKNGAKELILVAQDVTRYGEDLYKKHRIVDLIKELSKIKGLEWIRLHYCYPEFFSDELIDEIAKNPKVVKYIDIPIQHISDSILRSMNRASTHERVVSLIKKLRQKIPDVAIRTSIIVGFPGETEIDFKELCEFLTEFKLDNVGFFPYSREKGTKAYDLKNQVTEKTKDVRLKKLVEMQTFLQFCKAQECINKKFKCVCDDETEDFYILRNQYNSPEIDSIVYAEKTRKLNIGDFCDVLITDVVGPFDLKGDIL